MKGIEFRLQKNISQIESILIRPSIQPTLEIFYMNLTKFNIEALKIAENIISFISTQKHVPALFLKMMNKIIEATKNKPDFDQEIDQDTSRCKDQVSEFLNCRKQISVGKNLGELNFYLQNMQKKQRDTNMFIQHISKGKRHNQLTKKIKSDNQSTQTEIIWVSNLQLVEGSQMSIQNLLDEVPYIKQCISKKSRQLQDIESKCMQLNKKYQQVVQITKNSQKKVGTLKNLDHQKKLKQADSNGVKQGNMSSALKGKKKKASIAKRNTIRQTKNKPFLQKQGSTLSKFNELAHANDRNSPGQQQIVENQKQIFSSQSGKIEEACKSSQQDEVIEQTDVNKQVNEKYLQCEINMEEKRAEKNGQFIYKNQRLSSIDKQQIQEEEKNIKDMNRQKSLDYKINENNEQKFDKRHKIFSNEQKDGLSQSVLNLNDKQNNRISWLTNGARSDLLSINDRKQNNLLNEKNNQNEDNYRQEEIANQLRDISREEERKSLVERKKMLETLQQKNRGKMQRKSQAEISVFRQPLAGNSRRDKEDKQGNKENRKSGSYQKKQHFSHHDQKLPITNRHNVSEQKLKLANTTSNRFQSKFRTQLHKQSYQNLPSIHKKFIHNHKSQQIQVQIQPFNKESLTEQQALRQSHLQDIQEQAILQSDQTSLARKDKYIMGKINQLQNNMKTIGNQEQIRYYLQIIERIHRKVCGNNCKHLQRFYRQVKCGQGWHSNRIAIHLPTRKIGFFN